MSSFILQQCTIAFAFAPPRPDLRVPLVFSPKAFLKPQRTHGLQGKFFSKHTERTRTLTFARFSSGEQNNESWVEGVEDSLFAELETQRRKYHSATLAWELVRATRVGAPIKLSREDLPLWKKLNEEHSSLHEQMNLLEQLLKKYIELKKPSNMSQEDFRYLLYDKSLDLLSKRNGRFFSEVVIEWMEKYHGGGGGAGGKGLWFDII